MLSVAMATYNGEKYIYQQIKSILENLREEDELVISDDGSSDNTLRLIKQFNDSRIKVFNGPQLGINKNFENAIMHCTGNFIFLSDQDDVWHRDKTKEVLKEFEDSRVMVVQHDAVVIDENDNLIIDSFSKMRRVRQGFWKNIVRNTYHGAFMAFRSELKQSIIPFPKNGCFHDQWIGVLSNTKGKTVFLDKKLTWYRRYGNNASSFIPYPFFVQIKNRMVLMINLLFKFAKLNFRM